MVTVLSPAGPQNPVRGKKCPRARPHAVTIGGQVNDLLSLGRARCSLPTPVRPRVATATGLQHEGWTRRGRRRAVLGSAAGRDDTGDDTPAAGQLISAPTASGGAWETGAQDLVGVTRTRTAAASGCRTAPAEAQTPPRGPAHRAFATDAGMGMGISPVPTHAGAATRRRAFGHTARRARQMLRMFENVIRRVHRRQRDHSHDRDHLLLLKSAGTPPLRRHPRHPHIADPGPCVATLFRPIRVVAGSAEIDYAEIGGRPPSARVPGIGSRLRAVSSGAAPRRGSASCGRSPRWWRAPPPR